MGIEYVMFNGGKDALVWRNRFSADRVGGLPFQAWWSGSLEEVADPYGELLDAFREALDRRWRVVELQWSPDGITLRGVEVAPAPYLGGLLADDRDRRAFYQEVEATLLQEVRAVADNPLERIFQAMDQVDMVVVSFVPTLPQVVVERYLQLDEEAYERVSGAKDLTDPAWEHVEEGPRRAHAEYVVPGEVITLSAFAMGFVDGVVVTFTIERVVGGKPEGTVATIKGIVRDESVTSEPWTVPGGGDASASGRVSYRFHAAAEGCRTDDCPIPLGQGLEVWLEIDPIAEDPLDDTLELRDREGRTLVTIEVANLPDAAPGYKSLFLPMAPGEPYELVRQRGEAVVDYLFSGMTVEDLVALGEDPPRIETVFLLNGALDPYGVRRALEAAEEGKSDVPAILPSEVVVGKETLNVVAHQFFFLAPRSAKAKGALQGVHADQMTLVATDQYGRLCFVDDHFFPSRHGVQRPVGYRRLQMEPVAPGMSRYAYMYASNDWQKTLLDVADSSGYQAARFQALPVTVEASMLKTRDDSHEYFKVSCKLRKPKRGGKARAVPVTRYVFPKVQYVFLLIPKHVLSAAIADAGDQAVPPALWWKSTEGKASALSLPGSFQAMSWIPRAGGAAGKGNFLVYAVMSGRGPIVDGAEYRVELDRRLFCDRVQQWLDQRNEPSMVTSIQVDFQIRTLMFDVSFHVLEPLSLEHELLAAFPNEFAEAMYHFFKKQEAGSGQPGWTRTDPVKRFFERMDWWRNREKMVSETLSSYRQVADARVKELQAKEKAGELESGEAEAAKTAAGKERSQAVKGAVGKTLQVLPLFAWDEDSKYVLETMSTIYNDVTTMVELRKTWKILFRDFGGLLEKERFLWQNVKQIYELSERSVATKLWHAWSWNKWATNEFRTAEVPAELALKLGELRTPEELGELIKDGLPTAEEGKLLKAMGRTGKRLGTAGHFVGKGIDVAVVASSMWYTWKALEASLEALELEARRLESAVKTRIRFWHSRSTGRAAPDWYQVGNLMAQLRAVETLRVEADDLARKLLKEGVWLAVALLEFAPVVGALATTVMLVKNTVATGTDLVKGVLKPVDRYLLGKKLEAWVKRYHERVGYQKRVAAVHNMMAERLASAALPGAPWKKEMDNVLVQLWIREALLLGLAFLINRCGSPIADPERFERKVAQYRIKEYIEAYFGPVPRLDFQLTVVEGTGWYGGVAIGQAWLYRYGNKREDDNEPLPTGAEGKVAEAGEEETKVDVQVLPYGEHSMRVTHYSVPVAFQKWFPIHYYESDDVLDMVKVLARKASSVNVSSILFSRLYVWREGSWIPAAEVEAQRTSPGAKGRDPWPNPTTPIRVVVVLGDHPSLQDLPVSIELLRTDTWINLSGPRYKVMVERLEPVEEGSEGTGGAQQSGGKFVPKPGLFTTGPEAAFLPRDQEGEDGTSKKYYYGLVFYPYFIWRGRTFYGAKPTGHVPILRHQTMDVSYKLHVGSNSHDIGSWDGSDPDEIRVELSDSNSVPLSMTLDGDFLNNHSGQESSAVFYAGRPWLVGICLKPREGDQWDFVTAGQYGEHTIHGFAFDWMKPFEMIVVIGAESFRAEWLMRTDHQFPCVLGTKGPAYQGQGIIFEEPLAEPIALPNGVSTQRKTVYPAKQFSSNLTVDSLTECLFQAGLLKPGEKVTRHVRFTGEAVSATHEVPLSGPVYSCHLAAVRFKFAYSVQKGRRHFVYEAFKPFGDEAPRGSGAEPFEYKVTINLPGEPKANKASGWQPLRPELKMAFPPLPPVLEIGDDWDHLREDSFVTRKALWRKLDIWEEDYMRRD